MKDKNLNIRVPEDLRDEFQRVTQAQSVNPSELIRRWIAGYIETHRDKTKTCVTCPHCGHMTHVDLPTTRQGQVCGVCRVAYCYPWTKGWG